MIKFFPLAAGLRKHIAHGGVYQNGEERGKNGLMKNHILLRTNLVICLILLAGFAGITQIQYQTYRTILEDDIENISKLTSSHIYAEIDNELTKPIFVAQTMANDSFLKSWLYGEQEHLDDPAYMRRLQDYLNAYQQKYDYDAVYMISARSSIYYYYMGINKVVSPEDEHDDWYYDFLKSGKSYKLNIDSDEVNQNEMTVFVDCRVEGQDGSLIGTTGVGVKMSRLQELLLSHETAYDLQAFLVNAQGEVQVDSNAQRMEESNVFEQESLRHLRDVILGNRESMEMHWYPEGQLDTCIISRYIENLDWYLIIKKDTRAIRQSFQRLVRQDFMIVALIMMGLLTTSTMVIRRYNRMLTRVLNTDAITKLPNQKSFSDMFYADAKRVGGTLFLFDLDHFKNVNDTMGHLYGNRVLATVAQAANEQIRGRGRVARWGGDEFIGILALSLEESRDIFTGILEDIERRCGPDGVTVSIGATRIESEENLDVLLEQADQALYRSKEKGGNCLSCFEEVRGKTSDGI